MDSTPMTENHIRVAGLDEWDTYFLTPAQFSTRDRLGQAGNWKIGAPVGDHYPPHVHCRNPDGEVVVDLDTLRTRPPHKGNPKSGDIRKLIRHIEGNLTEYRRAHTAVVRRAMTR